MSTAQTLARLSPGQRVAAARAKAYELMPYFRSGIQSLVPREKIGFGTLGVSKNSVLTYDPDVMAQWTADEAGVVMLHEYLHIYMKHAERFERMVRSGVLSANDGDLFNEAADAEINDNLIEANLKLPKLGGNDPITPTGLGLKPHRTAEEYAQELKKRRDNGKGGGGKGPGWGHCGSGAGNPLPDEPPDNDPSGRTDIEQHLQRRSDSEQIRNAASRGIGKVPAGLAREAAADLAPAKVRWQDELSREVRSAVTFLTGVGDFTFTQRSRLQGSLEMLMGDDAPVIPGEHHPMAEVAVVVDTSGSMGDDQIDRICSEISDMLKHMGGARLGFVACDAAVHTCKRVNNIKEIRKGLAGGGGTDFRPAFEALDIMKPRPHVVVFATDGFGPSPDQPPKGMHVIWLIVDGKNSCPWGKVIDITGEDLKP